MNKGTGGDEARPLRVRSRSRLAGKHELEDKEADCDAGSGAEDDADQEDRDCPRTLEELSTEFGVSRERVRQIEVRAFEKVQEAVRKNLAAHERPRSEVRA